MRRRTVLTLAPLSIAALVAAGCSQPGEGGDDNGEGGEAFSSISIVTGGTSGLYYPIGGAIRQIIQDEFDGVTASVEATGASVENIRLLDSGEAQLAISQGDAADQALNGIAEFEDGGEIRTSALVVLYPNVYHTVTLAPIQERLGLECFSDVVGHRYSVGDSGSGNEATTNQVFESLGYDVTSDIDRRQLGYSETSDGLTSGGIDAGSWVVGQGHGSLVELGTTDDLALVPMCADEIEQILDGYGGYSEHTIPGGTYPGVDEDITTIATWNALLAPESMDEEQAYELTKAIFDNVDVIIAQYAPGEEYIVPETVEHSPVPLHPGAVRYYEEVGVEIPDDLKG